MPSVTNNQERDYWISVIGGLGGGIISGMLIWALDQDPVYRLVPGITIIIIVIYGGYRLQKLKL